MKAFTCIAYGVPPTDVMPFQSCSVSEMTCLTVCIALIDGPVCWAKLLKLYRAVRYQLANKFMVICITTYCSA